MIPSEQRRKAKAAFREAVDTLSENGVPHARVAKAFNVSLNSVDKWKMAGFDRYPPDGWERTLAVLCEAEADAGVARAEERGDVLEELARTLYASTRKGTT